MLRDDVLLLLTEAEGYVSGEEMREKLGVTRAAVSQAVRALRAAGYDIDAVTNRGYCLRARPDTLTAGDVLPYLPQARRALVQCFAQIDSTNSYLKAEAMSGAPDGLCAIADRQTAGRGRAGRSFRSDAGQGVYLSMLLRPACAATAAMTVTAHVAVAVGHQVDQRPCPRHEKDLRHPHGAHRRGRVRHGRFHRGRHRRERAPAAGGFP